MGNTLPRENYLVISAIGEDRPGIVNELAKACSDYQCNIVDSRMTVLGAEFALVMMVSGSWDAIAKLENIIPPLARKLDLNLIIKQTQARRPARALTYNVNVVALDHPGIVYRIAQFFYSRKITIDELQTNTYSAPHSGTQMFNINMTVNIPADMHLASLREEFMLFCDDLNLDAVLEPMRSI
ncbi:glycine cleavage system protein R [Hahella aquimaris]|nr:glycine cleavage system protein R [Hahella sp. HNIBRBA332]WLQ17403.1 glycine cleavage system protein R [Hahella sp. HNIBRBA332]